MSAPAVSGPMITANDYIGLIAAICAAGPVAHQQVRVGADMAIVASGRPQARDLGASWGSAVSWLRGSGRLVDDGVTWHYVGTGIDTGEWPRWLGGYRSPVRIEWDWLKLPFCGLIGGVNPDDCLLTELVSGMASLVQLQRKLQRALAVAVKVQQGDEA